MLLEVGEGASDKFHGAEDCENVVDGVFLRRKAFGKQVTVQNFFARF